MGQCYKFPSFHNHSLLSLNTTRMKSLLQPAVRHFRNVNNVGDLYSFCSAHPNTPVFGFRWYSNQTFNFKILVTFLQSEVTDMSYDVDDIQLQCTLPCVTCVTLFLQIFYSSALTVILTFAFIFCIHRMKVRT